MLKEAFERYLVERNLSDSTVYQKTSALRRIERAHDIDLDKEFERDALNSLVSRFSYSKGDALSQMPNPTEMDIDLDKLHKYLGWYRSHLNDYRRFRHTLNGNGYTIGDIEEEIETEIVAEEIGRTFSLERDLQAAIRANIGQLESGLTIADDGSEIKVEAGFIDILARDAHGVLTVIELKADVSRPAAIAQILAYMGCIESNQNEAVRGILVAGDHDPRVVMAARAVKNLTLKSYRYRFEFV